MGSKNPTQRFLKAAQSFLTKQNFEECRKHALLAQESDPLHPAPAQLIAIADVIIAFTNTVSSDASGSRRRSDYYSVLGVPRFTGDLDLIRTHFEKLAALLNPKENSFSLSEYAYGLVSKAWKILSNPVQKAEFDEELSMKLKSGDGSENPPFWTVCKHCYYLYEYPAEYQNCSMRCQNEACRRVFVAAAVSPAPPQEVIAKGGYDSLEGMPFMTENGHTSGKSVGMRKKMAANCSKKLMGKGVRVQGNGSAPV